MSLLSINILASYAYLQNFNLVEMTSTMTKNIRKVSRVMLKRNDPKLQRLGLSYLILLVQENWPPYSRRFKLLIWRTLVTVHVLMVGFLSMK